MPARPESYTPIRPLNGQAVPRTNDIDRETRRQGDKDIKLARPLSTQHSALSTAPISIQHSAFSNLPPRPIRNPQSAIRNAFPVSPRPAPRFSIQHSAFSNLPRPAFTLTEMLVVIAIIVMAMTLAIPAIRSLTGSRSQESAQNTLSGVLGTARSEAIARQALVGALFYIDTTTDRVNCALVQQSPFDVGSDPTNVSIVYIDLLTDRDPLVLPTGIRIWTMKDTLPLNPIINGVTVTDPLATYQYLGFNTYATNQILPADPTYIAIPGGVIFFDASGRLVSKAYGFHFRNSASGQLTALGQLVFGTGSLATPRNWPNSPGPAASLPYLRSAVGLAIFDRESFLNQSISAGQFTDSNASGFDNAVNAWINNNCTPVFINHYDASLMRAE